MRILVTGGCGFIGSNFIKHMVKKYSDYEITNYDKLTYAGSRKNLSDVEGYYNNYHFVKGDICDYKKLKPFTYTIVLKNTKVITSIKGK